ncbi:MAG: hypothetical protein FJW37_07800 [Acidobacteria bacterium]|nr:hypothetical protein [Acidobacteriota bacterium]
MNPTQFYISVAVVPVTTIIIVLIGVLLNNSRLGDLGRQIDGMSRRIDDVNRRIDDVHRRIDDLRNEIIRLLDAYAARSDANLRRVEEVFDARLNRIEEALHLR